MPIIHLIIVLVAVGVILWLVNNYIPMDGKIKRILNIVVIIAVIIWLLSVACRSICLIRHEKMIVIKKRGEGEWNAF